GNFNDSGHSQQVADQVVQVIGAVYVQLYGTLKNTAVRIHGNGAHIHLQLIRDDLRKVVDQAHPVSPHDFEACQKSNLLLACPACLDDTGSVVGKQFQRIGAGSPMNLDHLVHRDKSIDLVPGDGVAAFGQHIVDHVHILPDQ